MPYATTPDLTGAINAIKAKTEQVITGLTDPKEIAFLAKSVESLTGSVTMQQVKDEGGLQVDNLQTAGTSALTALAAARTDALDEVGTTRDAAIAQLNSLLATGAATMTDAATEEAIALSLVL